MMKREGNIESSNPFRVPHNYFNNLPVNLEDRVRDKEQGDTVRSSTGRSAIVLQPLIIAAAAMVTVVIITFAIVRHDRAAAPELSEILLDNTDEYLMIDRLSNEAEWELPADIESDEIINYLLSDDIDYALVIDKL